MHTPIKKPQSIAELINAQVHHILGKQGDDISQLRRQWPDVVGAIVAKRSRVITLDRKNLVVGVRDSVWMTELSLQKEKILTRLGEFFPDTPIDDLRFRLDLGKD